MLQDTSRLLGDLTDYAGVVVGPPLGGHGPLGPGRRITPRSRWWSSCCPTASVEHASSSPAVGEERSARRPRTWPRTSPARGGTLPRPPTGDARPPCACRRAVRHARSGGGAPDQVFVGGSRWRRAFDAIETVREVLGVLEQQYVVVTLLRDVIDRGLQVAIGTETGMAPLAECALIVAPYQAEGEPAGTIGVLGPSRMDYPQAMAAVAVVSRRLSAAPERRLTLAADFYDLLEVSRDASRGHQARLPALARELHPDTNPDPPPRSASRRSRWPTRCSPTPRSASATTASGGRPRRRSVTASAGAGINDIFDAFFGGRSPFGGGGRRGPSGPPRGQDIEVVADLTFEEAVFGTRPVAVRTAVACEPCEATGAKPGTSRSRASSARAGQVQRVRQSFLGQMVTNSICPRAAARAR